MGLNCPPDEIQLLATALELDTPMVAQEFDLYCSYRDAGDWANADIQLRTLEHALALLESHYLEEVRTIEQVIAEEREKLNRELERSG